jgi:hypothetical protein
MGYGTEVLMVFLSIGISGKVCVRTWRIGLHCTDGGR